MNLDIIFRTTKSDKYWYNNLWSKKNIEIDERSRGHKNCHKMYRVKCPRKKKKNKLVHIGTTNFLKYMKTLYLVYINNFAYLKIVI